MREEDQNRRKTKQANPFHYQQEPFSPSSLQRCEGPAPGANARRLRRVPTPQSFYSRIDPRNEMPGSSASVLIRQQQQIPKEKKNMYHILTGREEKKRYSNLRLGCKPRKINRAVEQGSGRRVHPFEACLGSSYPTRLQQSDGRHPRFRRVQTRIR